MRKQRFMDGLARHHVSKAWQSFGKSHPQNPLAGFTRVGIGTCKQNLRGTNMLPLVLVMVVVVGWCTEGGASHLCPMPPCVLQCHTPNTTTIIILVNHTKSDFANSRLHFNLGPLVNPTKSNFAYSRFSFRKHNGPFINQIKSDFVISLFYFRNHKSNGCHIRK